jgi:hypothetical protein
LSGEIFTVMRLLKWNGGSNEPVVKIAGGAYAIGAEAGDVGEDAAVNPVGDAYDP